MKIAIPMYRYRIAPLFDVAESFLLIDLAKESNQEKVLVIQSSLTEKCLYLHEQGVSILLCGALSRVWRNRLTGLGIDVYAFLAGDAQEVLSTFLHDGSVGLVRYAMPGCGLGVCGQRRHRRQRRFCDFDPPLIKE